MAKLSTVTAIPLMTSNTAPSGVASASSIYSSTYEAWKAFEGKIGYWESQTNAPLDHWISYKFPQKIVIGAYKLHSRLTYPTQTPKSWFFEGSNDGTTWEILDSRVNVSNWDTQTEQHFVSNNTKPYDTYRLRIDSTNNSYNKIYLQEFEMFELLLEKRAMVKNSTTNKHYSLDSKTLTHLPSSSDKNMILHGIESGKEIKLDEDFDKMKYVKDTSEVLGSGKKFTHVVDMSNTKINKITL